MHSDKGSGNESIGTISTPIDASAITPKKISRQWKWQREHRAEWNRQRRERYQRNRWRSQHLKECVHCRPIDRSIQPIKPSVQVRWLEWLGIPIQTGVESLNEIDQKGDG